MRFLKSENDFSTSVEKALDEIDENWRDKEGLIIAGSHSPSLIDEKLEAIKEARENGIPFLGICFGMELAAIEYARNVLGLKDANSPEIDLKTPHQVISKLIKLRVGIRPVKWQGFTWNMSHWHNYAFNNAFRDSFTDWNLSFTDGVLEVGQLKNHPHFVIVQGHPEYDSSKENPHPLLTSFLQSCKPITDGLQA